MYSFMSRTMIAFQMTKELLRSRGIDILDKIRYNLTQMSEEIFKRAESCKNSETMMKQIQKKLNRMDHPSKEGNKNVNPIHLS